MKTLGRRCCITGTRRNGAERNSGLYFTMIELLTVISILAILLTLLLPALNTARESGRAITCKGILKNVGIAAALYADSQDAWYPPTKTSGKYLFENRLLQDYLNVNKGVVSGVGLGPARYPVNMICPNASFPLTTQETTKKHRIQYAYGIVNDGWADNGWLPAEYYAYPSGSSVWSVANGGYDTRKIRKPSRSFAIGDSTGVILAFYYADPDAAYNYYGIGENGTESRFAYRHNGRREGNFLYFDGHIGTFTPSMYRVHKSSSAIKFTHWIPYY